MSGTDTFFASPERSNPDEIAKDKGLISKQALFKRTLDALPEILLILDGNRQIVYLNEKILKMVGAGDESSACGLRPGELFNCVNLAEAPNGCGTSKSCLVCGFVNAVLDSQQTGMRAQRECRMTNADGVAWDLMVTAIPLAIEGETFTIVSLEDISDGKRRQALERIFFHDIMNLAGGIQGISSILMNKDPSQVRPIAEMIEMASNALVDEIKAQRQLKQAEDGELHLNIELLDSLKIIRDAAAIYRNHEVAEGKQVIEEPSAAVQFKGDRTILLRVVGNMLKNALEATRSGGSVRIGCLELKDSGELEFYVGNTGVIPQEAQLQVFQRSFSTKGIGRGLGTYSIKLLGEGYLKGQVGFKSSETEGTVFHIRLKVAAGS